MNYFERQTKLKEMLLTVISSKNLGKTYDVDVFNPETKKQKMLKLRGSRQLPTSYFLRNYYLGGGTMKKFKIHEIGDMIIVEDKKNNTYRHLKFYSNQGTTWTLSEVLTLGDA